MSRESSTHLPVQPKLIRSRTLNRPGFNGDSVYLIPTNSFGRLVPA